MQKKWLAVALVSALVCSAATAVQAEVKIGVVSTEVILRDSAAAQAASKKLEHEELQKLLRQANTVIKNIAQREKYDLILQEAIYVNPKIDITDQVLKELK